MSKPSSEAALVVRHCLLVTRTRLTPDSSGDITRPMPSSSRQSTSLGECVQRLLREGSSAQAAEDSRRLTQVRDGLWQLLPEAISRASADSGQDFEATQVLIDIARPGIVLQMASGNWLQVLAACHCMNIALANVEAATHRDDSNALALEKMIVQLLHGFP